MVKPCYYSVNYVFIFCINTFLTILRRVCILYVYSVFCIILLNMGKEKMPSLDFFYCLFVLWLFYDSDVLQRRPGAVAVKGWKF